MGEGETVEVKVARLEEKIKWLSVYITLLNVVSWGIYFKGGSGF